MSKFPKTVFDGLMGIVFSFNRQTYGETEQREQYFPKDSSTKQVGFKFEFDGFFYNLYTYKHSSAVDIHTSYMYASNYSEENKNNYKLSDITT